MTHNGFLKSMFYSESQKQLVQHPFNRSHIDLRDGIAVSSSLGIIIQIIGMPLKVPNVEFDFDVCVSTLIP